MLVQAFLTLPLIALGLVWPGFRRLHACLARWPRPASAEPSAGQWPTAQVAARMVRIAARYSLIRLNCLPRSLTLWWLLRRQGIAVDLRIGVTPKEGRLEAHAWVELQGLPLDDQDDVYERFAPFHETITPPEPIGPVRKG